MFASFIITAVLAAVQLSPVAIYVSPTGDDQQSGTINNPLATLGAARDKAREHRDRPVTIFLRGGTHYLAEPLALTAADARDANAPLIFCAQPGETAVISGGQRLQLSWQPFRNGILQANVPSDFTSDQLFVNGRREPMARYPNFDAESQYFQGYAADCSAPARVRRWHNPAGGFLHAMHNSLWGDMHWVITGKSDDGDLQLTGGWQNNRQTSAHREFRFVENIFEELDAPGEWFLDTHTSRLYYYPSTDVDVASATIEAVRLPHLIEFRGSEQSPVSHITLRDLTFSHTSRTFMQNKEPLLRSDWTTYRGGALLVEGSLNCAIRNCTLQQVGGNAIFVNNFNRQLEISGCHVSDAGASAISFVGAPAALRSPLFEYQQTQTLAQMDHTLGPKTANFPAECLVDDCLIYRNGRVEKQTAGVNICMSQAITVRHCSIYDCPRAGINICDGCFGGHVIEFNDVFDTVKETGDHGSFNSWGRDRFWHPDRKQTEAWVAEHPDMPVWDAEKPTVLRNNRWRCDHGWDIDLDDGSSNYELYNNLCLAGGIKLREGYRRSVVNNIMVDYTFCPHVWYVNSDTIFKRNIVWNDAYATAGMDHTDQPANVDFNCVHSVGSEPQPASGLAGFGGDQHSIRADMRFLAPLAGDYRVADDSPAVRLGFVNFAMEQFGVQSPSLQQLARTPALPGTLDAAAIRSGGWGREYALPQSATWLEAQIKNIANAGEMSAVGLGDRAGVMIASVPPTSSAATFGLHSNDVIRTLNDAAITGLDDFAKRLTEIPSGTKVRLGIWRNQAMLAQELTLP